VTSSGKIEESKLCSLLQLLFQCFIIVEDVEVIVEVVTTLNELNTQGSHASWKVLDFFLKNSRTCMESPGKSLWSWKVLEIKAQGRKSWKNILESHAFF